jgi:hypothetical protein
MQSLLMVVEASSFSISVVSGRSRKKYNFEGFERLTSPGAHDGQQFVVPSLRCSRCGPMGDGRVELLLGRDWKNVGNAIISD